MLLESINLLKWVFLLLEKNCELGVNVLILGLINLGDKIKIAALACVTKNWLIPNSILAGVPAQIKK